VCGDDKRRNPINVRCRELIADRLTACGWSWGCVSTGNSNRQNNLRLLPQGDNGRRYLEETQRDADRRSTGILVESPRGSQKRSTSKAANIFGATSFGTNYVFISAIREWISMI